jgi:steroid delta-isomerase-like uncharacterized protein
MPVEDNKQAARRFYEEVINARNVDALGELLTPDGVDHTFGSQNAEEAKQFFGMVLQAFPDLHAEVHDVIAEGDLVAARVTCTGTRQGEFVGIPATGRQTQTSGVDWFRMQGGRQAEHLGRPRHAQLPAAAGRHARTRGAGTRHSRLAKSPGAQPPVLGQGATGRSVPAPRRSPVCSSSVRPATRGGTAAAGQGCVFGPLCTGDSRHRRRSKYAAVSVSAVRRRRSGPGQTSTWDLILIRYRGLSAVRTAVSPGRWRP